MARKYEVEDGRPVEWEEDVLYVRNEDGSISIVRKEEADVTDDQEW